MSAHVAGADPEPSPRVRWLLAGQQLLRTGGIGAVKLDALVESTGLTTGSFYHHFANISAFRTALAEFYGAVQVGETLATLAGDEPAQQIRRLARIARDDELHSVDAAMRDWAGSDPVAAEAVRALDTTLLRHLERVFVDMGFTVPAARVRAVLLFSSGVARVHVPWPIGDDPIEEALSILTRPDSVDATPAD